MALSGSQAIRIFTSNMVTDATVTTCQSEALGGTTLQTHPTPSVSILSQPGMGYQPQAPGVVQVQPPDASLMAASSTYIYLSNKDKYDPQPSAKIDQLQPGKEDAVNDLIMADRQETSINYSTHVNRPAPVMVFLNQGQTTNSSSVETAGLMLQHPMMSDMYHIQNNFSSIYAIAQANLVAQTQQDIAKQLLGQAEVQGHAPVTLPGQGEDLPQQSAVADASVQRDTTPSSNETFMSTSHSEKDGTDEVKVENDDKSFVCDLEKCGRKFSSAGHLRNHQTNHSREKPLECTHEGCGRTFTWPAHLKYHKLTHMAARNYACEMCDKRFYTAQRLKVHMRIHTGEKPFTCDECDKVFSTAGNLKNHKRVHSGERPYACSEEKCEKRFAEYSSLRKHMLTHSGVKPFKCYDCGRCFTQSGSRTIHMKKHLLAVEAEEEGDEEEEGEIGEGNKTSQTDSKVEQKNVVVIQEVGEDIPQYQDLHVVFSQGVSDHIVTVTTQSAHYDEKFPPIANEMLLSGEVFQPSDTTPNSATMTASHSSANVVVVAQPQMMVPMATDFHDGREEIVYDSEFLQSDLGHKEIAHNITDPPSAAVTMEISEQSKTSSVIHSSIDPLV